MPTDAFLVQYPLRDYSAMRAVGPVGVFAPLERVVGAPATGYLAGTYPGGATTVDNVPTSAVIRILVHAPGVPGNDSFFVVETTSAADGTWRVDGLPTRLKYDVVGRKAGYNDVIMTNVSPATS